MKWLLSQQAGIRLKFPFDFPPDIKPEKDTLRGPIKELMIAGLERDTDIVSTGQANTSSSTTAITSDLVDTDTGETVDIFFVDSDGNGGAAATGTQTDPTTLDDAETRSSASDVIFLLNDGSNIAITGAGGDNTLDLKENQQLLGVGAGTLLTVTLPESNTLAVEDTNGRPVLEGPAGKRSPGPGQYLSRHVLRHSVQRHHGQG